MQVVCQPGRDYNRKMFKTVNFCQNLIKNTALKIITRNLPKINLILLMIKLHFSDQVFLCTEIYDKRNDFLNLCFNFDFLMGTYSSYRIIISKIIRFASICAKVSCLNDRSVHNTHKLLPKEYRFHKLLITTTKI